VVELTADLAEENTTATQASEMLETESAERMRLEKELKDVQVRGHSLAACAARWREMATHRGQRSILCPTYVNTFPVVAKNCFIRKRV